MLEGFFSPGSVAIVGAAREAGKVGRFVLDNVLAGGYAGRVYPVNPKADEIAGIKCYPDIPSLPETPDLAIVVVPAKATPRVVEQCGEKGTRSVVVISAGFKETGPEGAALEREIVGIAKRYDIRLLGPNCLGFIAPSSKLNASFAATMPEQGSISFMSQSGALGTAILDWAAGEGVGLANFVSLGNKADVSEIDLMRTWREDPGTKVVVAYLESVANGAEFVTAAREVADVKPLIVLKSGRSDAGARAVSSHTGSLAGSSQAYEAAFRKAGALRADGVEHLFDLAIAFARQPLPEGPGVAILTNAGGPAILATDACEANGVTLASLERETVEALREVLPPAGAFYNPVDVLGDADAEAYGKAARIVLADPNVRSMVVILTPQAMTQALETAEVVAEEARAAGKPLLAVFMGVGAVEKAVGRLRELSVPNYPYPERAVAALAAMEQYATSRSRPRYAEIHPAADFDRVREIIDTTREAGQPFVIEQSASDLLAAYGVPVPPGGVARDLAGARRIANEVGYPVVLKIASPDILHKSDIGGIRVGIENDVQLAEAYDDILARVGTRMPDAVIWGVMVQKQLAKGRELIVGVNRDPTFGPLLLFGLGGVYVEVMKDVTFRLCPVSPEEARTMIGEIRGFGLLRGARGEAAADIDAIADTIVKVSWLAADFDDILEMDVNPLIVAERGKGAVAADVRIGIGG